MENLLKFIISRLFALANIPSIGSVMVSQMSYFDMWIKDLLSNELLKDFVKISISWKITVTMWRYFVMDFLFFDHTFYL